MATNSYRAVVFFACVNVVFLVLAGLYQSDFGARSARTFYFSRGDNCTARSLNAGLPSKRFLLVLDNWYREQMTQMQVVVAQMMVLAKRTDRILVLPPVANSHLWWPSARTTHPLMAATPLLRFSEYFDINLDAAGLQPGEGSHGNLPWPCRPVPSTDVVDMEEYLAHSGINREVVSLYAACWGPYCGPQWSVTNCSDIGFPNDLFLQWAGYTLRNDGSYQFLPGEVSNVIDLINESEDSDVAFVYYHKHIFQLNEIDPAPFFRPAKNLVEEADRFLRILDDGNFAAVQWRMEKTHLSWFHHLMPAVLKTIDDEMKRSKFKLLFIGTEFATNASDSWRPGEMWKKRLWYNYMIKELKAKYQLVEGYKSDRFPDTGQVAIVDRLVATKSELLIPVEMASSFANAIVKDHEALGRPFNNDVYSVYENAYTGTDRPSYRIAAIADPMKPLVPWE